MIMVILRQKQFGKVKAANKALKKLWEEKSKDLVLVGPKTKSQFRKINSSGITLTKHEMKGGIGAPTRIHNGREVYEINLGPTKYPVNHSINAKGIESAIFGGDISDTVKLLGKDPSRGKYTRVRWNK